MNSIEIVAAILVSTILSALFTFWALRRNNQDVKISIEKAGTGLLDQVQAFLDKEFDQFRPLISRSMTLAANAGVAAKKVQAFEREAIRAIQDDLPITPEMITAFSPRLGEMVKENPELLFKGREILEKLMGNQLPGLPGSTSRPHPFAGREE